MHLLYNMARFNVLYEQVTGKSNNYMDVKK